MEMTFAKWMHTAFNQYSTNIDGRLGMFLFCHLLEVRPDITGKLPLDADPFYLDDKIPQFLTFVQVNW